MISGKYLFDANDVLYSKIRPYLRKVVMAGSPGLCSSDIYPLKVAEGEILAEFLKWRLLAADFTAYADAESRRARMPKLNRDQLFSWAFALPPLSEQRQVVNRLCAQLAAVARARAAAEARLAATKALGACHLRNAFNSGEATHWPRVPLRSLAEIVSGVTLGRKLPSAPLRAVPYVTVANVKDGNLDLANVRTIAVSEVEIAKWRLRQGDLLLTEGGDPDKLGRGTFWDGQIPECIHQNHIFRVRST
jgi:type I restriction enzyme S subunit